MNPLESLAIAVILSVLQSVVKNPNTKAELQAQLVNIGTEILETYGYTVTAPPAMPMTVTAPPAMPMVATK